MKNVPENGMVIDRETLRAVHKLLGYPEAPALIEFLELRLGLVSKWIDSAKDDRSMNRLVGERKGLRFVQNLKSHIKIVADQTHTTLED